MAKEEKKDEGKQEGSQEKAPLRFTAEIQVLDTSKAGILERCREESKKCGESFHSGTAMKKALIRFVLDMLSIKVGTPESKAIGRMLESTPGWFGSGNNSACRQAAESKTDKVEGMEDYWG